MSESFDVDVHPLAASEIDEADDWYFQVNPIVAANFREVVFTAPQRIGNQPLDFPVFEAPIRRCVLRGFPYVILFDIAGSRIRVIAVAHTRRRPGYWKDRLDR